MLPLGSAEPGPWRSNRTPYCTPIFEACTNPRYRRVVAIMGSQMGKTEGLLNVIGHKLDDDPAPILYFGPTKSNIDGVIEPRVAQMLKSAPSLWSKTVQGRKAQKLVKRVAGVTLRLAWAGSPTELASQPAHTVLADEVDRMEPIPGEGDPVTLAEARIATYPDGRLIVTSTPTEGNVDVEKHPQTGFEHWMVAKPEDIASPSWRLWQEGTRYEWAVPCPHCREYFVPRFRLLWWPEGSTPRKAQREAQLICARNGCHIGDEHKTAMNAAGRYVAPGQFIENGEVRGEPPEAMDATFWASGLMSPWVSFGKRAADWLKAVASGDMERIRSVLNTAFGELYRVAAAAPPWETVRDRIATYKMGEVPSQVREVTAYVDVQKDRLVYVVRGWGASMSSWLLEEGEIFGETEHDHVWTDLAALRERQFGEKGLRIRRLGVDSGFRPGDKFRRPDNQVYAFCRRHRGWAVATKGQDRQTKPLRPSLIDVTLGGKTFKGGLQLWHLDTDYFKSWVHGRLEWPQGQPGGWFVPSDVTDDYCQQVTAEARVVKPSGHASWVRVRKANHKLDCEAGNVAMAYMLGLHRKQSVEPAQRAPAETTESQPAAIEAAPVPTPRPAPMAPRRSGFQRGWFNR